MFHELSAYRADNDFFFDRCYWRLPSGIEIDFVLEALLVSAATMLVVAAVYPSGATRALKWVQLVTIGTVVAIVLFVVLSLEHAYHGFLAVEPTAFEVVLQQLRG